MARKPNYDDWSKEDLIKEITRIKEEKGSGAIIKRSPFVGFFLKIISKLRDQGSLLRLSNLSSQVFGLATTSSVFSAEKT